MSEQTRVQELLDEMLDTQVSPEEVCRQCPELLPEVRRRWQDVCQVQAALENLFPSQQSINDLTPASQDTNILPLIPGHEVEAVIGRGGMGVVFRARHLRLNRTVALKMALPCDYCPHERERFQREAEAVAALQHPNIVQIHEIGDSDGRTYFTMEHVEGGTLHDKVARRPQPAREAAAIVATLAGAIEAAHQNCIVHRDLKPSNVLLTADGVPKIGDFGLARRLDNGTKVTLTGAPAGTPSYMSPEQARGKSELVGPPTDIYALGAILYEMLTGRPPFDADSTLGIVQKVIFDEPVPPSRLNPKVPRDLETICLKCLQKKPNLRYPTAHALGDDLGRYLHGEAIEARPIGRRERIVRWIRRNPTGTALILTGMALLGLAVGFWLREMGLAAERKTEMTKSAARLDHVTRLQREGRFAEAQIVLERVADVDSEELRARIERAKADLNLAKLLDAIRLNRAAHLGEPLSFQHSADEYQAAFAPGLGMPQDSPAVVAARIQESSIREALVAGLDDWAACTSDPQHQSWALETARRADNDSTGWRSRARDPKTWKSREALLALIASAEVESQSIPLLLTLAVQLKSVNADPVPFLQRIQQAHLGDFWANLHLAEAMMEKNNVTEAIRYYQAAAAIRSDIAVVHYKLGLALALLDKMDEAQHHLRHAAKFDSQNGATMENFSKAFSGVHPRATAIDAAKVPGDLSHQVASLQLLIGDSLHEQGKRDEAVDRYRQAIAMDAKFSRAHIALRRVLLEQGKLSEVSASWKKAIEAGPVDFDGWDGYAELALYFGDEAAFRRARQVLLETNWYEHSPRNAERAGRAALLLPAADKELKQAEALIDRALASDPNEAYYKFARGLLRYRQGRWDDAVSIMDGDAARVLGPAPKLVKSMAQYQLVQKAEARTTLISALQSLSWETVKPDTRDIWIFHILRREAEGMIWPALKSFLDGKRTPADNEERLELIAGCQYLNRYRAVANLYLDAFNRDSKLSQYPSSGHRYAAARAAALVSAGRGEDAKSLSDAERKRWRAQSLEWLRQEMAAWEKALEDGNATTRESVQLALNHWRGDDALSELRTPDVVQKLPPEERTAIDALWRDVGIVLDRIEKAQRKNP
jgi:serine/threonine-protein kinase